MLSVYHNRLVIVSILFFVISVGTILAGIKSVNSNLIVLSSLLLFCIVAFVLLFESSNFFSPLVVFSLMYLGYTLGGYYYAFSNYQFGKFVDFANLDRNVVVTYMELGLLYAIVCYLFFAIGYVLVKRNVEFSNSQDVSDFNCYLTKSSRIVVPALLASSLIYWYWVGMQTSGSFLDMLQYFQAFPHLAKDAGVSTLPYHLYYAGIFLWLLVITINRRKISWIFIVLSVLGMVMNATQGRIALAITFLMSQIIFIALCNKDSRGKIVIISMLLIVFACVLYYLRIVSNSIFIDAPLGSYELNFFKIMIEAGNVSDLQQLVLIFHGFKLEDSLIGLTYFDWIRNSFGESFGLLPSSVGLSIKALYIPVTSGAPTPGAIGESWVNFNFLSPLFLFSIGSAFAFIANKTLGSKNLVMLMIYSIFLARFVFLFPKVDSTMMSNFFWGAFPFLVVILFLYISFKLVKR